MKPKITDTAHIAIELFMAMEPIPWDEIFSLINQQRGATDTNGDTALHHAASRGWVNIVRVLLAQGTDPNVRNLQKETPLHYVANPSYGERLRLSGAVKAKMEEGYPPLPDAAWNGWVDTVRALLRQGAEVDARNNEGYTPLRYAADCGKADIVGALLDEGADPGIRDACGTSALDVIVQKARNGDQAFKNVVEFLKRTRPECVLDFWVTNK